MGTSIKWVNKCLNQTFQHLYWVFFFGKAKFHLNLIICLRFDDSGLFEIGLEPHMANFYCQSSHNLDKIIVSNKCFTKFGEEFKKKQIFYWIWRRIKKKKRVFECRFLQWLIIVYFWVSSIIRELIKSLD